MTLHMASPPTHHAALPTRPPAQFSERHQRLLQEILAEHQLLCSEYIAAVQASMDDPPALRVVDMFDSWDNLYKAFIALGFLPRAECHWRRLGLAKLEGPEPTRDMIERRARLAGMLTTAAAALPWASAPASPVRALPVSVEDARAACAGGLQQLISSRRRVTKEFWPRWWELIALRLAIRR